MHPDQPKVQIAGALRTAHKHRLLLAALGISILFFPFIGAEAAIILFMLILACVLILMPLLSYAMPAAGRMQDAGIRLKAKIFSGRQQRFITYGLFLFLAVLPFFAGDYLLDVAILTGIYAILALGLNVMVGFAGLLNLGYAAFYAVGAYSFALLNVKLGLGFWQAVPLCVLLTTASGFALAVPALRLKGDYLAIVTLGFGEIVRLVLNNWDSFTGGPNGISGIASPYLAGVSMGGLDRYYYITLLAVILAYVVIKRVLFSRIGRAWIAIREDDIGAAATGINTTRYKLYAVAFGASWAGLAGALFASKMQFVSPESFTFMESVLILSMVILGGLGNMAGVVMGALVLVALPEVLREVQSFRMITLGAGLVAIMIFRPHGLLGKTGIRKS